MELAGQTKALSSTNLAAMLTHVEKALPRLSDALAISYFVHSSISRAGSISAGADS